MSRSLREGGDDLIRCHKCPHRAVIRQRYSGMVLCREHFQEDVQRKAREDLRQTGLFARRAGIMIELDGGRNSSALAYILKKTFQQRRDIDLVAVVIDEVGGESLVSREAANVVERLNIPLLRESLLPLSCGGSYISQSSQRRQTLIDAAQKADSSIIATGEDLDEESLKIFLRYLQGDLNSYACGEEELHWIKPLRRIPKREVRLYASILGLGSDRILKPDPDRMQEEAGRLLNEFNCRHPGTNYSLLRGWERLIGPGRRSRQGAKPLSRDAE